MRVAGIYIILTMTFANALGQHIDVDYDKTRDFSRYKTFNVGEGEVTTPKDNLPVDKAKISRWMKDAIIEKLSSKGLQLADSSTDLVVSYAIGSMKRNEQIDLGNQIFSGVGGGSQVKGNSTTGNTWSRDIQEGSIIIDLKDKSSNLLWRVNATTGGAAADNEEIIRQVVNTGFKKFSLNPKKAKREKGR